MSISDIPPGPFCYRVVKLADGEKLNYNSEQFGKELREFHFIGESKRILCPYWVKTERNTVRCNYLNREFYDDWDLDEKKKILEQFNTLKIPSKLEPSHYIIDEIKICGIAEDNDAE